jgi:hypothetical protein
MPFVGGTWLRLAVVARPTNVWRQKDCEAGAVGQAAGFFRKAVEVRMGSDAMPSGWESGRTKTLGEW